MSHYLVVPPSAASDAAAIAKSNLPPEDKRSALRQLADAALAPRVEAPKKAPVRSAGQAAETGVGAIVGAIVGGALAMAEHHNGGSLDAGRGGDVPIDGVVAGVPAGASVLGGGAWAAPVARDASVAASAILAKRKVAGWLGPRAEGGAAA